MEIIITCHEEGITKPRETLEGVGILQVAAGCQVAAQELLLPPISTSKETSEVTIIPKPLWQDASYFGDAEILQEISEDGSLGAADEGIFPQQVEGSTLKERAWVRALFREEERKSETSGERVFHNYFVGNVLNLLRVCDFQYTIQSVKSKGLVENL